MSDFELDYSLEHDAQRKADEAAQLLRNDAFNDAFQSLTEDIEKQLFLTDPADADKREVLYHLHRAAQMFVNNIALRINHFALRDEGD